MPVGNPTENFHNEYSRYFNIGKYLTITEFNPVESGKFHYEYSWNDVPKRHSTLHLIELLFLTLQKCGFGPLLKSWIKILLNHCCSSCHQFEVELLPYLQRNQIGWPSQPPPFWFSPCYCVEERRGNNRDYQGWHNPWYISLSMIQTVSDLVQK